jgi:hypothetical protein
VGPPLKQAGQKRLKLWHFAVVVVIAALIFATIRAIRQGPRGPAELIQVSLVVASACGLASLALFRVGRKMSGRATAGLKQWGFRQDDFLGFVAFLVAVGLEVCFTLAALVIGPVVAIVFFAWLAGLIGG